MDEERFDHVVRTLQDRSSRRGVLGALAALAALGVSETGAKRHRHSGNNQRKSKKRSGGTVNKDSAKATSEHKSAICHQDENGTYHRIDVAESAVNKHLQNHDDFRFEDCCQDGDCAGGESCTLGVCTCGEAPACGQGLVCEQGACVCPGGVCAVTPANLHGWQIAPNGTVPVAFTPDQASIGSGSIAFGPIAADNPANKFIMFAPYQGPVSDLTSFDYDFFIEEGEENDSDQFYVNVYVDLASNGIGFFGPGPGSTGFYDCRYDLVPSQGAVGVWRTNGFTQSSSWTNIANRTGTCPNTLAGLPAGSTIIRIALNGGESTLSDAELKGRYDNVIIGIAGVETTFDFEP